MSNPSEPILFQRPLVEFDKLTFWWRTPVNDGDGSGISSYTLSCFSPPISTSVDKNNNFAFIQNVSAGTEYSFSILAYNSNGLSSPLSTYPTVVPGSPPTTVTNVQAYRFSSLTDALVTWSTPTSDGNSPIRFNRITCYPYSNSVLQSASIKQFTTYPNENSRYLYGLSSNFEYKVYVEAQNDVYVSPSANAFSTLESLTSFSLSSSVLTIPPLTPNNGQSGITFELFTNSLIKITNFTNVFTSGSTTAEIRYRIGGVQSTLGVAPIINSANDWIVLASGMSVTGNSSSPIAIPSTFSLYISANTTVGFYIGGATRYQTYVSGGPSNFTDGRITLRTGSNAGYGGVAPNPTNHPRQFLGSVLYYY